MGRRVVGGHGTNGSKLATVGEAVVVVGGAMVPPPRPSGG